MSWSKRLPSVVRISDPVSPLRSVTFMGINANTFIPGEGAKCKCQVEALVALWISKFILPELLEDIVQTCYFPLGIRIAKGVVFPLASLILGHLYTQMESLHRLEY
ncbi:hypothetical protein L484_016884 [Morus notabilis]|uniref:Uncharacterized protein n=1 Tax=Morus notabilis TaxID=981085 RepID=W9RWC5_9ROSA|nr:hypothetical protein L484_016884 [Morus notabilis]